MSFRGVEECLGVRTLHTNNKERGGELEDLIKQRGRVRDKYWATVTMALGPFFMHMHTSSQQTLLTPDSNFRVMVVYYVHVYSQQVFIIFLFRFEN